MAYPSQQPRYGHANNNYYDGPRSAPLESPREYRDDGYGGQYQQQNRGYDDGYGQSYNQGGRQAPPPRQQRNQGPSRQPQGYLPQGRPQQRGPGPVRGQMRDPRAGGGGGAGGGYQGRGGGYNQQHQYGNGAQYQQGYDNRQNGYSDGYQNQDSYADQYDNGYGQDQYDDGYGYQQSNNYGPSPPQQQQQFRPPQNPGPSRGHPTPQQRYDQHDPNYQPRTQKAIHPAPVQTRDRILPQQPHSPDTVAWDNPFPTFPAQDKHRPEEQRPSTANGRYQDHTHTGSGQNQQQAYQGQNDFSGPNHTHHASYHDDSEVLPPNAGFAHPQRSNTMPTDLAQNMANLNIQPSQVSSNAPSKHQSPPQHLNFSQPRRPSAGGQSVSSSRHQSQSRQPSGQGGGYNDLLESYEQTPGATPPNQSAPFASPGTEEMPNFDAAQGNGADRTLHIASQETASLHEERGRDQSFQAPDQRSRSQPGVRADMSHDNTTTVSAVDTRYAQNGHVFPPRQASNPQQYQQPPLEQQQYGQDNWQQPPANGFGPPVRAQTDMYGPGQAPKRNPSDPYHRAPSRGMGPSPVAHTRTSASSQPSAFDSRGTTPVNGQRMSSDGGNRPRPGMTSPDNSIGPNGSMYRGSAPDTLPGHPVPTHPGQLGQSQSPPGNQTVLAARPPPVRHYNGSPSMATVQQVAPQQHQSQPQLYQPQPQQPRPQVQPQPQAKPIPVVEGPVTYEELQRIRGQVQQDPSNQALELHLAKRLLEAATTLADEGGRADNKTKSKNRQRYTMEASSLVKKLVGYNYTEAMFYMAECYGNGTLGLPKDPAQAFTLYQSAAKLNHAPSAYRVAVCCELGSDEGGGTRRDPLKAVQWYQRAATLGDVPAMYKIGVIKLKGLLGQQQNPHEAVTWLRKAAEHADAENPHALHELALLYMNGGPNNSIAQDEVSAAQLLHQAADLGYKFSQFRLGAAYEFGQLGFPIDARQSITWYSKAATQEEHQSELALSGWYLTGAEGIMAQNDTEAYLWARKAANSGLAKAEYAMGYFSEVGIGCPPEIEGAKRWYWKAASQNFPKARERLEELRRGGPKMQKARVSRGAMQRSQGDCKVM